MAANDQPDRERRALLDDILRQARTIDLVSPEILALRVRHHAARLALGDGNTRLTLMTIAAHCLLGVEAIDRQRDTSPLPRLAPSAGAFQRRLAAGDLLPPDDVA